MPHKIDQDPAISGQIVPHLPFAVEPDRDLLTPAQERALAALLSARSLATHHCGDTVEATTDHFGVT